MKTKKLLIAVCVLVAVLPVLLLRDYTPGNELRYLSIADEALRRGTLFAFTNQGMAYADKPPLYFWLLMAARWLLGRHAMWLCALFSLLPAAVIARTMDRWAGPEICRAYQPAALWMLLSCGLFAGTALFLRPDMLMCMFIVLALRTFYRMLKGEGSLRRNQLLFPVWLFLGLFSKGPIALLVPLVATTVFLLLTGRLRTWGRYWGLRTWAVLSGGCALWFAGVCIEGGTDYLENLLLRQTLGRAVHAFHHREPVWYYALSVWYTLLPWSLLVAGAVAEGLRRGRYRSELQKFFLVVAATTFVLLSCISSKIQVYLLPAFPFLIYFTAMQLSRVEDCRWPKLCVALPAAAFCLAPLLLWWLSGREGTHFLADGYLYAASGILFVVGAAVLHGLWRGWTMDKAVGRMAFGLFAALFVGGWALPKLNGQWGYADVCREAERVGKGLEYGTYRIHRSENMDVFLGRDVRKVTEEELHSGQLPPMVLLYPVRAEEEVRKALPGQPLRRTGRYGVTWPGEASGCLKPTRNVCCPSR